MTSVFYTGQKDYIEKLNALSLAESIVDIPANKAAAEAAALAASGSATSASTSATSANSSASSAVTSSNSAQTTLNTIKSTYYGALSSVPTLRPDNSSRQVGDRYYNTITGAENTWNGVVWYVPNIDAASLANATDTMKGAAMIGYDARSVKEQLGQVTRIENIHALRDFWKSLFAFNSVENSTIAIASYGDSVSGDIAGVLSIYLLDLIGRNFSNITTFGNGYSGTLGTTTYTGGAAQVLESNTTSSLAYLPTGSHYVVPSAGTITFNSDGQTPGFNKITCYLAKIPGGGNATVDLLNEAMVVVSTVVVNTANATVGAAKADFIGLDVNIKYRLRVTASTASIVALGIAMIRPRGITYLAWGFGGTTLDLQNTSPKSIFDFINFDLNVKLVISECKGEANVQTGFPNLLTRLSTLSTSIMLVGSRPDVQSTDQQLIETRWVRNNAVNAGCAFVDAGNILKDYAEMTRLGWNGDGTHLPNSTAYYVASLIFQSMPTGALSKFYATRDVVSKKVMSEEYSVASPINSSVDSRITFAKSNGAGESTSVRLFNIARLHAGGSTASQGIGGYGQGMAIFSSGDTFGDITARSFQISPGSTSISAIYQLRMANAIEPAVFTVANLPVGFRIGAILFASNGRRIGEGAGAGSGVLVYISQGNVWRRFSDDTQVLA